MTKETTEALVVQFHLLRWSSKSVYEDVEGRRGGDRRRGEGDEKWRDCGLEVEHCGRRSPGRFLCTLAVQAATARPLPRRTPAGGYALESAAASWGSARSR